MSSSRSETKDIPSTTNPPDAEIVRYIANESDENVKKYLSQLTAPLSKEVIFADYAEGKRANLLLGGIFCEGLTHDLVRLIPQELYDDAMIRLTTFDINVLHMLLTAQDKYPHLTKDAPILISRAEQKTIDACLFIPYAGTPPLSLAFERANDDTICTLIEKASKPALNKAARLLNDSKENALHALISAKCSERVVDAFMSKLDKETIDELLLQPNVNGEMPFALSRVKGGVDKNFKEDFIFLFDPNSSDNMTPVYLMKYLDSQAVISSIGKENEKYKLAMISVYNPAFYNVLLKKHIDAKKFSVDLQGERALRSFQRTPLDQDNRRYLVSQLSPESKVIHFEEVEAISLGKTSKWRIINYFHNKKGMQKINSSIQEADKLNQQELLVLLKIVEHLPQQMQHLLPIIFGYMDTKDYMMQMTFSKMREAIDIPYIKGVHDELKACLPGKNKKPVQVTLQYLASSPYTLLNAKKEIAKRESVKDKIGKLFSFTR